MRHLKYVIDEIYDYFLMKAEGIAMDVSLEKQMILSECDCFFLISSLEPIDVDLFIINYLKYISHTYPEFLTSNIVDNFNKLRNNILSTALKINDPAIDFLKKQRTDDFIRGYLI